MSYFDHRHGNVALAALKTAVKALQTAEPHLARAGCAEWVYRMISVEATRLESLRAEAERSIEEARHAQMAATATDHQPTPPA
jgi:hypothetical protein